MAPWWECQIHVGVMVPGRDAGSMVAILAPRQGCWIWDDKPQCTCSNGQCRIWPLSSPHPGPLWGS